MARKRLYDQKCFDLAEAFLSDEGALDTAENRDELAGDIQVLIEDFILVKRRELDRKQWPADELAALGQRPKQAEES